MNAEEATLMRLWPYVHLTYERVRWVNMHWERHIRIKTERYERGKMRWNEDAELKPGFGQNPENH